MGRYKLLLLCLFVTFLKFTSGADDTNDITLFEHWDGRIVNGTVAYEGQFPQQVSLRRRYSQNHFCGGSILTSKWILTAGHCMFSVKTHKLLEPYTLFVVAGEIVLKSMNHARQWSYVSQIIVHPEFDRDTLHNDVALLKLSKTLKFDEYVSPIPLVSKPMTPDMICQVSGWGYQKYRGMVLSPRLLYVDVPLVDRSLCQQLLENITDVPEGRLCAGYLEGQRDACEGDSGGGLICDGFLTGVVSDGYGCAEPAIPGWYADVEFYTPWIMEHVNLTPSLMNRFDSQDNGAAATSAQPLHFLPLSLGLVASVYSMI